MGSGAGYDPNDPNAASRKGSNFDPNATGYNINDPHGRKGSAVYDPNAASRKGSNFDPNNPNAAGYDPNDPHGRKGSADMTLMILTDAKVLLDMTLMLHQERVPTLTPTTPMLLDMIRVHLDMILVIQTLQERAPDLIPMHQGKVQVMIPVAPHLTLMKHPEKVPIHLVTIQM